METDLSAVVMSLSNVAKVEVPHGGTKVAARETGNAIQKILKQPGVGA